MERISQGAPPEMREARTLPGREAIRRQELERTVGSVIRYRSLGLPALALVVFGFVLIAPTPERLVAFGALCAGVTALSGYDWWRLKSSGFRWTQAPVDLAAAIAMQTVMIAMTGLIDSPFLVIHVAMSFLAGVAFGRSRANVLIVAWTSLLLWLLAALELEGSLTQVAAFFPPPPELASDTAHVLGRAAVTQAIIGITTMVGRLLNGSFTRMLDAAIDARERLLESLAGRNQELVDLSGALAHELKNPLASIQGLVTLLERSDDNRERRFEVLRREIDRTKGTLDELLQLARPVSAADGAAGSVEPGRLFSTLAAEREGVAEAKGVVLSPAMPEGELPLVADEKKLSRALKNLLDNAIDASPSGAEVSWVARKADGRIELGVADRGPGVAQDVRARAGTAGFTTKPEGSGLGLAVARVIAEQHGGTLELRERPGGGTEALLVLPARSQEGA